MSTIKVQNIQHTASSTNAIALASDGTCTANITNNLSNRNLIINGAMRVAQRATTYTGGYGTGVSGDYYKTVDRQFVFAGGLPNTDVTTSQINITTGSPYDAGFRKAFQISMGYQGSVPTNVQVAYSYRMEAQDLACSGWKHTSSSSYLTLSFWVRSSVAQTFYGQLRTIDGTSYHYPFSYALSADTWTKIVKTIPGNSNLTLNNDNGEGLRIDLTPYYGTDYTNNSVSLNAWGTHSNSAKTPDQTSTWYSTNGATWQITGLQLEVGSVATDFEHRSFAQELLLCQRYFYKGTSASNYHACGYGTNPGNNSFIQLPQTVEMRVAPTFTHGSITNGGDQGSGHGTQVSYIYLSNNATNSARISEYTLDAEL